MKYILLLLLTSSTIVFSQEFIPEGWDKIILENEVAYMNLVTGDVSKTLPRSVARKPIKVKEYDPTQVHYVKKGDTYSKIARKYNMSLSELYRLNSAENFDKIEVGQEVVIGYREGGNNNYTNTDYHIVKSRETLFSISQKHGISVNELKSLNALDSNFITVGQRLNVR